MSKLVDIKRKIDELDGGAFQNLCDVYLTCKGYKNGYSLGMVTGTNKTAKGNPDTYFLTADNKYVFVMYTTQKTQFVDKALEDIAKCFDEERLGIKNEDIAEIIFCHTYGRLSPKEDKSLRDYCRQKGAMLNLIGIDELGNDIFLKYPKIAKDELGISVDTGQIMTLDSFLASQDKNKMSAPLNTEFMFRDDELKEAEKLLEQNNILVVYGPSGVGKTRFSVELCRCLSDKLGYETVCIKSNGLEIYEDLVTSLESEKEYIAFVDDANELTGLHFVLDNLNNEKRKISKLVITVRDYARQDVIKKILDYDKPEKIKLDILKDDDIRKLVDVCFGIKNNTYSDRIVAIAEGNARIAMLAGKLVSESESIESIMDASELYNSYYGKQLETILTGSETEIKSAGIIAFLQSIRLDNLERFSDLFEALSLSSDAFIEDIKQLHSLEVVDLCNDIAARISDQCFSNFLIKYVFVDKKIIPLDLMIKVCFDFNKARTISACNILLNVFSDENLHKYLEEQINIIWDEVKDNAEKFEMFFKSFHMIRPTETLLIIKERIDKTGTVSFDTTKIDIKNEDGNQIKDDIISVLCNFHNHQQLPEAIELLLQYYEKRPDLFEEFYTAFVRELGIDANSQFSGYYSIKTSVSFLCNLIKENRNINTLMLFVKVAKYYLKFVFSRAEGGRRNTFTFYNIPIGYCKSVLDYRKALLENLKEIFESGAFVSELENFLKNYCSGYRDSINFDVAKEEIELVLSFLEMLDKDNLHHCSIAKHLKSVTDETRIDYDDAIFMPFIDSPKYKILQTLKGNRKDILSMSFEETQQKHRSEIESLVVGYGIDEFKTLFLIAKESVAKSDHNAYEISQGLRYAFDAILNESSLYVSVVELYIQMDTPCNIHPSLLIRNLFDIHFVGETKKLIEKYDFSEKNTWLWCYYAEMPKENITQELCTELLSFLSEPDISIKSASYRPIDSINKYKIADEEIIVKASRILSENYDKSPFVFDLYFVLLFNPHNISVSNLFEMYASDHSLLEDIYLKSASYSNHCDYDGTVLMNLLDANPDVLNKYLNTMLLPLGYRSKKYESCMNRLEKIWLRDDFINIADMVVHSLHTIFVDQKWEFEHCLESFLTKANGKERSASNQDKWIIYCIENNYNDIEFMSCLFGAISEMSNSRRKDALIKFISLNDDYEAFERIQLEPSSWGGCGSMIPYMQARIDYLSSLMPVLSGVKYLKHKQRIEHYISVWEEQIKREEIDELLERWD